MVMTNDFNELDKKQKEKLKKFIDERQNISGLTMSHYLEKRQEKKKKGNYIDKFFNQEKNLKLVKETFYIGDKKFTTNKLVEKENE